MRLAGFRNGFGFECAPRATFVVVCWSTSPRPDKPTRSRTFLDSVAPVDRHPASSAFMTMAAEDQTQDADRAQQLVTATRRVCRYLRFLAADRPGVGDLPQKPRPAAAGRS